MMRKATKLDVFDVILWKMVCECVFACGRETVRDRDRVRGTVGIAAIELAITNLDF